MGYKFIVISLQREALCGLPLLVSIWFQILFHPPSGVLFTFPSRYLFTIGQYEYLALDLSRPDFQPDFSCLVVLKKKLRKLQGVLRYGTVTLFGPPFQACSATQQTFFPVRLQPHKNSFFLRLPSNACKL